MIKKIISSFTMVAFIIFSLSCYSTKNVRLDDDAAQKVKKGEILRVVMTSGETIEFSKEQPGRIFNESITGTAVRVTGELDEAYIKSKVVDKKGKILRIIVSIPISEVMQVGIREYKTVSSIILMAISVIGIAALVLFAVAMSKIGN